MLVYNNKQLLFKMQCMNINVMQVGRLNVCHKMVWKLLSYERLPVWTGMIFETKDTALLWKTCLSNDLPT